MGDLFGNEYKDEPVRINIYADEIQERGCPYTKEKWVYIGIVVERFDKPLLDEIIRIRHMNNFDENSPYFEKNNRIIHWSEINDADTKNIAKRWLEYILSPSESGDKFYGYILGINISKLNIEEFDTEDKFRSIYNRFFRSAILYALKTFFPNNKIVVENIYHEEGPQRKHKYFPWHCIHKLEKQEPNINFIRSEITFLPKSHRENDGGDRRSNLIQMCDLFLGVSVSLLHGIQRSNRSKYREELAEMFSPLFNRMINEPKNINSSYRHANRIMIRFFPRDKTAPNDIRRLLNQFYTKRRIYQIEKEIGQGELF